VHVEIFVQVVPLYILFLQLFAKSGTPDFVDLMVGGDVSHCRVVTVSL